MAVLISLAVLPAQSRRQPDDINNTRQISFTLTERTRLTMTLGLPRKVKPGVWQQ